MPLVYFPRQLSISQDDGNPSAETYLDLVVIISPFALEPSIDLPRVEAVIRDLLDSMPGHGE